VLAADAFSRFEEEGIFNRETGQSFLDNILSRGGSEEPMVLFKRFRGASRSWTRCWSITGLRLPRHSSGCLWQRHSLTLAAYSVRGQGFVCCLDATHSLG
jgi:hypothetical protein